VLALGVVGFVAYQVLSGPVAPQQVEVPAVAGMSENDARAQIQAAGLRVGDNRPQESPIEQKGRVISTDPQPGTKVSERSVITLIVGGGPANVTVPRLEGSTPQEAQAELEKVGLTLGSTTQQPTSDPSLINHVIDTNPKAGVSVKGGDPVGIIVGIQQTGVKIPDVIGQDLDDAVNALRDKGLKAQVPDGSDDNDKVTDTSPQVGQTVPEDSTVVLLTGSSSDDEARMPNVVGKTQEQAVDQLTRAGFQNIQRRRENVSDESQDGRVLEQSIQPGERVPTDQQITLTVADAPGGLFN
jgi:serine/threonine-protein kinase